MNIFAMWMLFKVNSSVEVTPKYLSSDLRGSIKTSLPFNRPLYTILRKNIFFVVFYYMLKVFEFLVHHSPEDITIYVVNSKDLRNSQE